VNKGNNQSIDIQFVFGPSMYVPNIFNTYASIWLSQIVD
jgi:hypothetical protein